VVETVKYDLLVKGGLVIDPSQGIHDKLDVAVFKGRIVNLGVNLNPKESKEVLEVDGQIVTPGVIDLHTHVFYLLGHKREGLKVDSTSLAKGVTTVLDAGSFYPEDVEAFRYYIVERSRTRVYALLSMKPDGNPREYGETVKANRDFLVGIKYHHGGLGTMDMLILAREAADWGECMLMCEPYGPKLKTILEYMYKGDVLTHSFHPPPRRGLLDEDGKVLPEVWEAIERGVYLDQGHGRSGFSFEVAEKCLKQGLPPFTISTDLHKLSVNGPVYDMPTTMSKWMALGMSLEEVIKRSTLHPAIVLKKDGYLGTLKIGACADISCFKMFEGEFVFEDSAGEKRTGRYKLEPMHVVRSGEVVF